jgi:hypothetical protein
MTVLSQQGQSNQIEAQARAIYYEENVQYSCVPFGRSSRKNHDLMNVFWGDAGWDYRYIMLWSCAGDPLVMAGGKDCEKGGGCQVTRGKGRPGVSII